MNWLKLRTASFLIATVLGFSFPIPVSAWHTCLKAGGVYTLERDGTAIGSVDIHRRLISLNIGEKSCAATQLYVVNKPKKDKIIASARWSSVYCSADFPLRRPLKISWTASGADCTSFSGKLKPKRKPAISFVARRIADRILTLKAESGAAPYDSCYDYANFSLDGSRFFHGGGGGCGYRGVNVAIFNGASGELVETRSFDTWFDPNVADELVEHLDAIPIGTPAMISIADEGTLYLSDAAKNAIVSLLGSTRIFDVEFRGSWAMISIKGLGQSLSEAVAPDGETAIAEAEIQIPTVVQPGTTTSSSTSTTRPSTTSTTRTVITSTTSTTTTLVTCPGGIIGDPNGTPEIQITDPQPAQIRGVARNVNTDTQRMVCYAITNHAYIQPDIYAWGADICSDGLWVTSTYPWGRIVCLIVEKSCFEPKSEIFTDPTQEPCVLAWDEFPKRRFVQFAGRILEAKYSGPFQMDPGPNYFSDSEDNIYVDAEGRLHLRIAKDAQGRWMVSELIDTELATYGEYEITIAMPLASLAESEVRAWFIYHYFLTQEADIEISDVLASPDCMQFVMQPYTRPGNIYRFCAERDIDAITFRLVWRPDRMEFMAWRGRTTYPPAHGDVIAEWAYMGPDVLIPDFERVRLNNWLFNGIAPADDQPHDFIIERFTVRPLTSSTTTTSLSSTTSSTVRPTTTTSTTSTTTTQIPTITTTSTTSTTTTSTTTATTTSSTTTTIPAVPDIAITFLSPYGDLYGIVSGTTRGVDPASFAIAVYIKVRGGWWTKPYFDTPLTVIRADSTWTCDITTGGVDEEATDVTAFLVPSSYSPPEMRGGGVLPDELFVTALDWTSASRTPLS